MSVPCYYMYMCLAGNGIVCTYCKCKLCIDLVTTCIIMDLLNDFGTPNDFELLKTCILTSSPLSPPLSLSQY